MDFIRNNYNIKSLWFQIFCLHLHP